MELKIAEGHRDEGESRYEEFLSLADPEPDRAGRGRQSAQHEGAARWEDLLLLIYYYKITHRSSSSATASNLAAAAEGNASSSSSTGSAIGESGRRESSSSIPQFT